MAMSGITVKDDIKAAFDDMKHGKKLNRYMLMKISDNQKEVVIEKFGLKEDGATFQSFVDELPRNECRFAVVDYDAVGKDTKRDVLVFIAWSPDTAPIKSKMMYASTKESVKGVCRCNAEIQATDVDELASDIINEKCHLK